MTDPKSTMGNEKPGPIASGVVPHSMARELGAVLAVLLGLFVTLALATSFADHQATGALGLGVAQLLQYFFGYVLAYTVPLAFFSASWVLWQGQDVTRLPERILGGLLLVFATGGLTAMPWSSIDLSQGSAFFYAGAAGHGLVHSRALNLPGTLGMAGCALVLSSMACLGILLLSWRSPRAALQDVGCFLEWLGQRAGMIRPVMEVQGGGIAVPSSSEPSLWDKAREGTREMMRSMAPAPSIHPPKAGPRSPFRVLRTTDGPVPQPSISAQPREVRGEKAESPFSDRPVGPDSRPGRLHGMGGSGPERAVADAAPELQRVSLDSPIPEWDRHRTSPDPGSDLGDEDNSALDVSPARREWPGFPRPSGSTQRRAGEESCVWISGAPPRGTQPSRSMRPDSAPPWEAVDEQHQPRLVDVVDTVTPAPEIDSDFAPTQTIIPSRPVSKPVTGSWDLIGESESNRFESGSQLGRGMDGSLETVGYGESWEPASAGAPPDDQGTLSSSSVDQLWHGPDGMDSSNETGWMPYPPPGESLEQGPNYLPPNPPSDIPDTAREHWRAEFEEPTVPESEGDDLEVLSGEMAEAPGAWREAMNPAPGIWPGNRSQADFLMPPSYSLPRLDLFDVPPPCQTRLPQDVLMELAERLQICLSHHNIDASVEKAVQGPAVIRFDLRPAEAQRVAPIARLDREIAIAMRSDRVRILGPGAAGTIGVEIPSPSRETVYLIDLLKAHVFRTHPAPLAVPLGRGMSGEPVLCDLAATPHLLIAGSTGQGKSVCLNSILISLLMRRTPDELRLLLVDPKQVELNFFRAIPHLLAPIVTEPRKAAAALQWVCEVMEHRYELCKQLNARNIDSYNAIARGGPDHPKAGGRELEIMPHIIVVIDELADLMLQVRREIEEPFSRLAAKARACGIHLIVATQRPSVDVVTGTIKNNFPSRIAFLTKTEADSRTVLGQAGAETLLGKGDMIYDLAGARDVQRVQGCFVSEADVERLADYLRAQGDVRYVKHDFPVAGEEQNRNGKVRSVSADEISPGIGSADDEMERTYERALRLVLENRKASVSMVQRKLQIGFPKAGRLMDMMEERGIVGAADSSRVREILVDPEEFLRRLDEQQDGIYYDED